MAGKTVDRRVRRTRELLQHALEELILEKGYEAVTVQDILDRADVGRSTFYAHFRDKEDLLLSGFEQLHETMGLLAAPKPPAEQLALISAGIFTHASEAKRFFKAMLGRNSGDILLRAAQRRFSDVIGGVLDRLQPDRRRWTVDRDVAVQWVGSALLSTLVWWLDSDAPFSAEEMDAMFRRVTLPGVAAALGMPLSEVRG